ncbi:MAG TPA: hypothetical protein VMV92_16400 [Streptosporangiaceae bacterium]|nr:hypothetical protein [Streptosporangiaceae bacterium]
MPDPGPVPAGTGKPADFLDAITDALRELARNGHLAAWSGEPASMFVRGRGDWPVPEAVLAIRDGDTGAWWYWPGRAEQIPPATAPATAAPAQVRAPERKPEPAAGQDRTTRLADGAPREAASAAGTTAPVLALAALRTELAARRMTVSGLAVTRLQGTMTLASGPAVRYRSGWLIWPAGPADGPGSPPLAIHRADDPAGAARRLTPRSRSPASPVRRPRHQHQGSGETTYEPPHRQR